MNRRIPITALLLLAFASLLSAQEKPEMVTRIYEIPLTRMFQTTTSLNNSGDPFGGMDPFAAPPQRREVDLPWAKSTSTQKDIQEFFSQRFAIDFPEGSWIRVIQNMSGSIVMHNTLRQHEKMRWLIDSPENISIHLREVAFDGKFLEQEERENEGPLSDVQLHHLWKEGKGETLTRQSVTTINGVNAIVQLVDEIIYPTEMTVNTNATSRVIYGSFDTRETGAVLNITPTVQISNREINLVLLPEMAQLKGKNPDHPADLQPFTPVFTSHNLTTSLMVENGGVLVVSQSSDPETGKVRVLFISAELLNPDGTRFIPPDPSVFEPEE